jgi:hypothetical protein
VGAVGDRNDTDATADPYGMTNKKDRQQPCKCNRKADRSKNAGRLLDDDALAGAAFDILLKLEGGAVV